eukprot:8217407-Prorocentrum_lima.AAC.1
MLQDLNAHRFLTRGLLSLERKHCVIQVHPRDGNWSHHANSLGPKRGTTASGAQDGGYPPVFVVD